MKYQQIHLSRLSRAAGRLEADGKWHVYATDANSHYRVTGKTAQRVRFEKNEDAAMLGIFEELPPLPARLLKEGFREEITIRNGEHGWAVEDMFLRLFVGWDQLAAAGAHFGIKAFFHEGNALQFGVRFDYHTAKDLTDALITARAFSLVAADLAQDAREGVPHTVREIRGLISTAMDVLREELAPEPREESGAPAGTERRKAGSKSGRGQISLFPDQQE